MWTVLPMKKVTSVTWRSRGCLLCHVHRHITHTHVHTSIPTPTLVLTQSLIAFWLQIEKKSWIKGYTHIQTPTHPHPCMRTKHTQTCVGLSKNTSKEQTTHIVTGQSLQHVHFVHLWVALKLYFHCLCLLCLHLFAIWFLSFISFFLQSRLHGS